MSGQRRGNRIEKIKQWVIARKRRKNTGYGRPASSKKMAGKLFRAGALTTCFVLVIYLAGGDVLKKSMRSFSFFNVNEVRISGNTMISDEKLKHASGIVLYKTSLLNFSKSQVRENIETFPWIHEAIVKCNWPSTIEISVKENVPVGLMLSNDFEGPQLYYIDRKGVPFLKVQPGADVDYPVVTGLSGVADEVVRKTALDEVLIFLKAVRSNNPLLPAQSVSEIHVDSNGEMVVYLVEYTFPIFFGNGNTKKKYYRLVRVLSDLYKKKRGQKELISKVEFIQMKYLDDNVLVAQSGPG